MNTEEADKVNNAADAFLNVRRSALGNRWQVRPFEGRIAEAIAAQLSIPLKAAEIMAARGVSIEGASDFYTPSIKAQMPDPSTILDMDRATSRIVSAVMDGEEIAIFGDYDVDGATSSAIFQRYLTAAGGRVRTYIPDRMQEGYGPNAPALLSLAGDGVTLVITVDCGTLSFEPLQAAADAGLDVIIVDHHKAEATLPEAIAVVNPNRLDESGALTQLAAVGVSFMVLVAVNRLLKERGWFGPNRPAPDLLSLLDIVALGTVCDVVPLTGLNRAFVAQGLKVMAKRQNIGLTALSDVGRIDEAPTTYHAGFILGPRVNAGGRVGCASLGTRLLTTESWDEAKAIALELDGYNQDRRVIEAEVQEAALAAVTREYGPEAAPATLVFAAGKDWHPGVIGIVASRLKERYNRPTFVLSEVDGEVKGSGRSISGVDMGAAIIEAAQKGLVVKGGGHAMAAGLSATPDQLAALKSFLEDYMAAQVKQASGDPTLTLDGALSVGGANLELISAIERVGPYGVGNPGPRFALQDTVLVKCDIVGADHIRAIFKGKDGASIKAMAFRAADNALGHCLRSGQGRHFHIAGKLKRNEWNGRVSVEMMLDDVYCLDEN